MSYGAGTADGPAAVLQASRQVDLLDRETGRPYRGGIAMLPIPAEVRAWSDEARRAAVPVIEAGGSDGSAAHEAAIAAVDALGERMNGWVYEQARRLIAAGKLVGVRGRRPLGAVRRHPRRRGGPSGNGDPAPRRPCRPARRLRRLPLVARLDHVQRPARPARGRAHRAGGHPRLLGRRGRADDREPRPPGDLLRSRHPPPALRRRGLEPHHASHRRRAAARGLSLLRHRRPGPRAVPAHRHAGPRRAVLPRGVGAAARGGGDRAAHRGPRPVRGRSRSRRLGVGRQRRRARALQADRLRAVVATDADRRCRHCVFSASSDSISSLAAARSRWANPANSWPENSASPPSMVTRSPVRYGLASLIR